MKIKGDQNFFISASVSGQSDDENNVQCDQTLTIKTYSDKTMQHPIQFQCTWKRCQFYSNNNYNNNNKNNEIFIHNDKLYVLSGQDVGCHIIAEVTSREDNKCEDNKYSGTGEVDFGVVSITAQIKADIGEGITRGNVKCEVGLVNEHLNMVAKQKASITVTQEYFVIEMGNSTKVFLKYSINTPEIQIKDKDNKRLSLAFHKHNNPDYTKVCKLLGIKQSESDAVVSLVLKTKSKEVADFLLLAIRCFAARKFALESQIISNLHNIEKESFNNQNSVLSADLQTTLNTVDSLLTIAQLKQENHFLLMDKESQCSKLKDKITRYKDMLKSPQQIIQKDENQASEGSFLQELNLSEIHIGNNNMNGHNENELKTGLNENNENQIQNSKMLQQIQQQNEKYSNVLTTQQIELETMKLQAQMRDLQESHKDAVQRLLNDQKALQMRHDLANMELAQCKSKMEFDQQAVKQQTTKLQQVEEELKQQKEASGQIKKGFETLQRDSILAKAKLIEERNNLKTQVQQIGQQIKLSSTTQIQAIINTDTNNNNNNTQIQANPLQQQIFMLQDEVEKVRKTSIIERGRLIEEKNKLKEEIATLRLASSNALTNKTTNSIINTTTSQNQNISMNELESDNSSKMNVIRLQKQIETLQSKSIMEKARLIEQKQAMKDQLSAVQEALNESQSKINTLMKEGENEKNQLAVTVESMTAQIFNLNSQNNMLQQNIQTQQAQIKDKQIETDTLYQTLQQFQEEQQLLQSQIRQLQEECEEVRNEKKGLEEMVELKKNNEKHIGTELASYTKMCDDYKLRITQMENEISSSKIELQKKNSELEIYGEKVLNLQSESANKTKDLSDKLCKMEQQCSHLQTLIEALESEKKQHKAKLDNLKETHLQEVLRLEENDGQLQSMLEQQCEVTKSIQNKLLVLQEENTILHDSHAQLDQSVHVNECQVDQYRSELNALNMKYNEILESKEKKQKEIGEYYEGEMTVLRLNMEKQGALVVTLRQELETQQRLIQEQKQANKSVDLQQEQQAQQEQKNKEELLNLRISELEEELLERDQTIEDINQEKDMLLVQLSKSLS